MAFQMAITIGGAVWLGTYLDRTFQTTSHAYTLTLSILGVGVGMFNAIRDLSRM
jgi:F0F1-type ATP synthase assembly protein I